MIRKNLLKFKLNLTNQSSSSILETFMKDFSAEREQCPACGSKGHCRIFAYYRRWVIDIYGGEPVCTQLDICRVKCTCGHTHAILPDCVIPYSQYSLPFVLYILLLYFRHSRTIEDICVSFGITHSMIYRWKKIFEKHKSWWISFTRQEKNASLDFLNNLLDTDPFTDFSMGFFCATLFSFLQSHANPSNCCRAVPGWPPSGPDPT